MSSAIRDKMAIVTGGTRGIGFAIARALGDCGATVLVCGRRAQDVGRVVSALGGKGGMRVFGMSCDVRDHAQVRRMFEEAERLMGGLDVLVNNAGVGVFSNVEKMQVEEWKAILETNLSGVFHCCREAIPAMKRRGGGYIINIGSLAGRNAFPGGAAYNASKFGLIGFSEALMQEVRYENIRVSYVLSGSVNTEFARNEVEDAGRTWKLWPEDVAQAVVHLLEMDPRALPSCVELRPARPRK